MHDATKVVLGSTQSNHRVSFMKKGTVEAGKVCRLKSDDTVTTVSSDGEIIGISLGKDLSDTDKISILAAGLRVPVLLGDSFTPAIGAVVYIDDADGIAVASATDATVVNAVYRSQILTGINEAGTSVNVALIDFAGGL
jgi:hypothetical protein